MAHRHARQHVERGVVRHLAAVVQQAAVPVVGVRAQADVGDHHEIRGGRLDRPHGLLHGTVGGMGCRRLRVLAVGHAEQQHAANAGKVHHTGRVGQQVG